jgi:HSP20 family protein
MLKETAKEPETKKVTTWRPLWNPGSIERSMERMFKDFFREPRFNFGWPMELRTPVTELSLEVPKVEIYEDKNDVVVKAELPGMKKEDLDISFQGDILTIRGEKKSEQKEERKGYYYSERSYGAIERSIEIPEKIVPDKIRASFKDGVLEVRLEKSEEAKKRETKIKVE